MLFSWPLYWLLKWALYSTCRTVFTADILEVSAGLLYPRPICMLKGVLFSLFTSSVRLIPGSTILSPQQYWYLAWSIASSAMLFSWPLYWLLKWALYSACRTVFTADILEVSAGLLYPRHICVVKGVLFSFFSSSLGLISGFLIMSPQQCSNLGIRLDPLGSNLNL